MIAFDFRGHGDHYCENETDLSEETLIRDSVEVVQYVCAKYSEASVILVGHSMGGSIAKLIRWEPPSGYVRWPIQRPASMMPIHSRREHAPPSLTARAVTGPRSHSSM